MKRNSDLYDFSEYPTSHPCYSRDNRLVVGKFKDELKSLPMEEFVGLRSKMYSFIYRKGGQAKGTKRADVQKNTVKNKITHDDYVTVLFRTQSVHHEWNTIRSFNHDIFTVHNQKKLYRLSTI